MNTKKASKNTNKVYFFLHIPKTAGTNIKYDIKRNYSRHEYLSLWPETIKGLNTSVYNYVKSINKKKRKQLKIIAGHKLPYKLNTLFKNVRIFTFIRDPDERAMSFYNYKMTIYKNPVKRFFNYPALNEGFFVNNKPPDFETWLKTFYTKPVNHYGRGTMTHFLQKYGYYQQGKLTRNNIIKGLKKFYFIGLTKTFNTDIKYIYEKIGMKRYSKIKNKSDKYVTKKILDSDCYQKVRAILKEANETDRIILDIVRKNHAENYK